MMVEPSPIQGLVGPDARPDASLADAGTHDAARSTGIASDGRAQNLLRRDTAS